MTSYESKQNQSPTYRKTGRSAMWGRRSFLRIALLAQRTFKAGLTYASPALTKA